MTARDLRPRCHKPGFAESPSRATPDTDFVFPGSRHLEGEHHHHRFHLHRIMLAFIHRVNRGVPRRIHQDCDRSVPAAEAARYTEWHLQAAGEGEIDGQ